MICPNCGRELPEGVFFCPNCGVPVADRQPENGAAADPGPTRPYEDYQEEHLQHRPEPQSGAGQTPPNDTKAIVSLCCGVVAAICMLTGAGSVIGIVAAVVGLVFGIKARKENPSTMATVGIVLCALNLLLCALVFVGCLACIGSGVAAGAGAEILEGITT
ncbi:MAG: zinc-ribbon domain-containing protein [Firmicutes bacterium]|nr:zinc-ribbon domain-containing protein [Bacillota bacterium]